MDKEKTFVYNIVEKKNLGLCVVRAKTKIEAVKRARRAFNDKNIELKEAQGTFTI